MGMDQKVQNAQGQDIFNVSGTICQMGMCCPCCFSVNFDASKNGGRGVEKVGGVEKMPLNCEEMCLKTNRFTVDFGKIKDPIEKRMLFSTAMLLDRILRAAEVSSELAWQ